MRQITFLIIALLICASLPMQVRAAQSSAKDCPVAEGTPVDLVLRVQDDDGNFHPVSDFLTPIGNWLNAGKTPDLLGARVEGSLQDYSGDLGAAWRVNVTVIDLSGDGVNDVVIDVVAVLGEDQFGSFIEGAVLGYVCDGDRYQPALVTELHGANGGDAAPTGFYGAPMDLNQNGIPDFLVGVVDGILGPRGNFTLLVMVYEWDGEQFALLSPLDENGRTLMTVNNGGVVVREDGTIALEEQWVDRYNPFDVTELVRRMGEAWQWNADTGLFERGCAYAVDAAAFRIQAIEDGDLAFACGDYEAAISHYDRALESPDLAGWSADYNECPDCISDPAHPPEQFEELYLGAYAGYRKVLAYTVLGEFDNVEATLEGLEQVYFAGRLGIEYLNMARLFWMAYQENQSLAEGCDLVHFNLEGITESLFVEPDIYSFYFGQGYFEDYLENPESICSFE